jgi:hypothetical protein
MSEISLCRGRLVLAHAAPANAEKNFASDPVNPGAVPAAADVGVKRIPIASIKLGQGGLTRRCLILGGGQNNTPMRRAEPRYISIHRPVLRIHPSLRAANLNFGGKA